MKIKHEKQQERQGEREGERGRKRGKVSRPFCGQADWISAELTYDLTAGPEMGSDTHFPFLLPGNSHYGDHMTLPAGHARPRDAAADVRRRRGEKN